MVTLKDFIHRLKSQNHLSQHNKQYDRKVLLRRFHLNWLHFRNQSKARIKRSDSAITLTPSLVSSRLISTMVALYILTPFTDPHQSPPGKHLSFYQGDIRLSKKQAQNLKKYGDPSKNSANSRAASSVESERWPNAVIPYTFDCSVGKTKRKM